MERELKDVFLIVGVIVMVLAALILVFVDMNSTRLAGTVILFLVGFGCCIAGTEPKDDKEKKL